MLTEQSQLIDFHKEDEARWRHTEQEFDRQSQILDKYDLSEKKMKEGLRKAGVKVKALEKESEEDAEQLRQAHEELLKMSPPPSKARKDRILLDELASFHEAIWLYPPAYEGWGNTDYCGFNLTLGEINTEFHDSGSGGSWGLLTTADSPKQECTLWFYYYPPRAGELLVEPHVDFQGIVAASAHDHWYTSTQAHLKLMLHFDLYQHYWGGRETHTIINEDRRSSSTVYRVDEHKAPSKTLSVSANEIVWIKLTTELDGEGRSDHARVDCDFRTGSENRIRVEHIRVHLT